LGNFLIAARSMSLRRSVFTTAQGYIGLRPKSLRVGDVVCVLLGAGASFILRAEDDYYLLGGECYVYGIMDGKAFQTLTWKGRKLRKLRGFKKEIFEIHWSGTSSAGLYLFSWPFSKFRENSQYGKSLILP
jgi:hypothetical protein